jgi:hypothetical protein
MLFLLLAWEIILVGPEVPLRGCPDLWLLSVDVITIYQCGHVSEAEPLFLALEFRKITGEGAVAVSLIV